MKMKWYFSTLIIILTLLGISRGQFSVPNQEIVIQFLDDRVTSNQAKNAIDIIKEQLQSVGVYFTQVREEEDQLIITYYSDVDIANVKKALSKKSDLELDFTDYNQDYPNLPVDSNSNDYNIAVYEIQSNHDLDSDLNGYALELQTKNDRSFTPNILVFIDEVSVREKNRIEDVAYAVYKNSAAAIDHTLFKIPEGRAGPVSNGDS